MSCEYCTPADASCPICRPLAPSGTPAEERAAHAEIARLKRLIDDRIDGIQVRTDAGVFLSAERYSELTARENSIASECKKTIDVWVRRWQEQKSRVDQIGTAHAALHARLEGLKRYTVFSDRDYGDPDGPYVRYADLLAALREEQ